MEISNLIPFDNLCQATARKKPFSKYADFAMSLIGWLVFNRETKQYLTKGELYNIFRDSPEDLRALAQKEHPDYNFISKDQWDHWKINHTNAITDR